MLKDYSSNIILSLLSHSRKHIKFFFRNFKVLKGEVQCFIQIICISIKLGLKYHHQCCNLSKLPFVCQLNWLGLHWLPEYQSKYLHQCSYTCKAIPWKYWCYSGRLQFLCLSNQCFITPACFTPNGNFCFLLFKGCFRSIACIKLYLLPSIVTKHSAKDALIASLHSLYSSINTPLLLVQKNQYLTILFLTMNFGIKYLFNW